MALALTMLAGTIVTVRGFASARERSAGLSCSTTRSRCSSRRPFARYRDDRGRRGDVRSTCSTAMRAEPGVADAALTTILPPEWGEYRSRIFLEGEPRPTRSDPARTPRWQMVTPGYFATMDIPLVSGRSFTDHDDSTSSAVIVVSESMARAYWPGREPARQANRLRGQRHHDVDGGRCRRRRALQPERRSRHCTDVLRAGRARRIRGARCRSSFAPRRIRRR